MALGMFVDERADDAQRDALQVIFGGQAGGWPGEFANLVGEVRGIEYIPAGTPKARPEAAASRRRTAVRCSSGAHPVECRLINS